MDVLCVLKLHHCPFAVLNVQFTEINLATATGLALLTPSDSTCLYDLTNLKWLLPPTYPANSQPIVSSSCVGG